DLLQRQLFRCSRKLNTGRPQYLKCCRKIRQNQESPDRVLQLANVAGPFVSDKGIDDFRRQLLNRAFILVSVFFYEKPAQQRDVLWTLPQWWNLDTDDIQPIVKIFSELSFGDRVTELAVGSGEDTSIR